MKDFVSSDRIMRHYLEGTKDLSKCYNLIYRDTETPQEGVCGWNQHQSIQILEYSGGIQKCSTWAQTHHGYYFKDCWMEK